MERLDALRRKSSLLLALQGAWDGLDGAPSAADQADLAGALLALLDACGGDAGALARSAELVARLVPQLRPGALQAQTPDVVLSL
ncbi:unnamed protein product [Prorocentrum cordatum]|uniref:MMS19 nucleotide excision repair protein n=1 Tax=Prorocentrum cordatum TaxID=2364126 RepID=A0ABN9V403_9DINO|nr:unnamed protein product [Polarella glacialis]